MQPVTTLDVIGFLEWIMAQDEAARRHITICLYAASDEDRRYARHGKEYADGLAIVEEYCCETGSFVIPKVLLNATTNLLSTREDEASEQTYEMLIRGMIQNSASNNRLEYDLLFVDVVGIVVSFLDWVVEKGIGQYTLIRNLDAYISEFCDDKQRFSYNESKRVITTFFSCDRYLNRSRSSEKKHRSRLERYIDCNIYKCIFLGLAADNTIADTFIEYWEDLDAVSADFLDIIYSPFEMRRSGYSVANSIAIDSLPLDELPCIVVWRRSIKEAEFISVSDFDERSLFHCVACLVMEIKRGCNLEEACDAVRVKATEYAGKRREAEQTIAKTVVVTQNISNNAGVIVGANVGGFDVTDPTENDGLGDIGEGGMSKVKQIIRHNAGTAVGIVEGDFNVMGEGELGLAKEVDEAKKRVDELAYLSEVQRHEIDKYLDMALSDDANVRTQSREGMKALLRQMGTRATVIIGVLANLAQIAQFFGL